MKYTWEFHEGEELWYNDVFDTIEDCILDAKENYDVKSGATIVVGEPVYFEPYVDAINILEQLESDAYDECGEFSESWTLYNYQKDKDKIEELSEKLTEIVKQWLKDNGTYPTFSIIKNVRVVEVE